MAPKPSAQDKAERTTQAAASIMTEERKASDAKVARLKALRLAKEPEGAAVADSVKPAANARPPRQAKASTIRKLSLENGNPSAKRRAS